MVRQVLTRSKRRYVSYHSIADAPATLSLMLLRTSGCDQPERGAAAGGADQATSSASTLDWGIADSPSAHVGVDSATRFGWIVDAAGLPDGRVSMALAAIDIETGAVPELRVVPGEEYVTTTEGTSIAMRRAPFARRTHVATASDRYAVAYPDNDSIVVYDLDHSPIGEDHVLAAVSDSLDVQTVARYPLTRNSN